MRVISTADLEGSLPAQTENIAEDRCCAAHFGVSFNSLLVGGVFAVTAEPPLSVNT